MPLFVALLLVAAVALATLQGFGIGGGRVQLGWLALACVIAAVWMIPALQAA